MQHANAPSGSDEGQKHASYWSTLGQFANKIDDQVFLFAIVISIILLGVAIFASAPGFIVAVIATLAFAVIIMSFVGKLLGVEERQNIQQKQINDLVTLSMSPRVFRHLAGITILKEYKYREGMQED
jgi:ABC-type transport system involved in cytochrome bd biosynthesis fused ATPase/permease subunit